MFVLIWAILLFSLRGNNAARGASAGAKTSCSPSNDRYCITLTEGEITSEAGLCVVIPCSFTTDYGFSPKHLVWFKCEANKERCSDSDVIFHTNKNNNKVQSGYRGRVSLLEPDVSRKNCSIVINDLKESDSGSYQLRVNGIKDGFTFSTKATIKVKDLSQKPTLMIPPLKAGHQTTLTCTAPGLCSGSDPKITWTWRGAGEKDSHITGNITAFHKENLTAVTQRHSSTLTFNVSAEHHGSEVTCKVSFTGNRATEETATLNVTYVKKPVITGTTAVKEGDALNLTCRVESFPPLDIIWTKVGSNRNLQNETRTILQKDPGTATLVISNVTADHSGRYICTAEHEITNGTAHNEVTVKFFPRILSSSVCEAQSEVLTCVCVSEGFPLPTIKWQLSGNYIVQSVSTSGSDHRVSNTLILTVKHHSDVTLKCISDNDIGEAKEILMTRTNNSKQEDLFTNLLITVKQPQVIVAFLIGTLLSGTICCLVGRCHRNKQERSGNVPENLEMVTTQAVPLTDDGGGAGSSGQSAPDGDVEPKEVEYSDIDFSALNRRSAARAVETQQPAETEYAEIKKEATEARRGDGDDEEGEVPEGSEEEEAAMVGGGKEAEQRTPAEEEGGEGGEDVALYSNVNEIMSQT